MLFTFFFLCNLGGQVLAKPGYIIFKNDSLRFYVHVWWMLSPLVSRHRSAQVGSFFFLHLILVSQSSGGNLLLAETVWSSIRIAFDLNSIRNFALVRKISIMLINKLKSFSQAKSFFHPNPTSLSPLCFIFNKIN